MNRHYDVRPADVLATADLIALLNGVTVSLPDDTTPAAPEPDVLLTWREADEIRVALARATGALRATVHVVDEAPASSPIGLSRSGIAEIEAAATEALTLLSAAVSRVDTR